MRLVSLALGLCCLVSCGDSVNPAEDPNRRELLELSLLVPPSNANEAALFGQAPPMLIDVLDALQSATSDEHVAGLYIRLGPMGGAWGRVGDLREAIDAFRNAGKKVHCHFETLDNAGYALAASVCDHLTMTPSGALDTVGIAAQMFFARALLERIGAQADFLHVGEFKSAAEPFTRDDMSEANRLAMSALLDDIHASLLSAMSHRGLDDAQAILDAGPYGSEDATARRLVDDLMFEDEAREHAEETVGATTITHARVRPEVEPLTLTDVIGALSSGEQEEETPDFDHIALVYVDGDIRDGEEPVPGSAVSSPFVRTMRDLEENAHVRAVVMRINSPGGSALASDRMWRAVRRVVAAGKPVVVSVGEMAASGGYYIAAAANRIVAHPASIVGSIGVVGGKISVAPALENMGVHVETLRRGAHSGWATITEPFDETERASLQRMMEATYRRFVQRVVEGRSMSEERVLASAEGRVWSGEDGLERGLIDRLGGFQAAIQLAREEAGLADEVELVEWPARKTPLETLMTALQGGEPEEGATRAMLRGRVDGADYAWMWVGLLASSERVFTALPVGIAIH